MKIVFLCGNPFEENRYGVSEHVFQLSKAIVASGPENKCHIVSMDNKTEVIQMSPNLWLHTVERKFIYYLFPSLAIHALCSVVKSINPDVVHLHGVSIPYVFTATALSAKLTTVVTLHGDPVKEALFSDGFAKVWGLTVSRMLLWYAVRKIGTVIVCSEYMKSRIDRYKNNKIYVIPNGVDTAIFHESQGVHADQFPPYIFYIGSLKKVKGVDILIKAVSRIVKKIGPLNILIAGTGREYQKLTSLAHKEGLDQTIRFVGFVSGSEKVKLIQNSYAVVIPSRYESFGIVVLESLACGVPVVASRIGGIPEIVLENKSGLLFTVGDEAELANSILTLIQNPEYRNTLSRNGSEFVVSFSWSRVADATIDVYQKSIEFKHNKVANGIE